MSAASRDIANLNRVRAVELTPWARAAVGDTSGWVLPAGYRIVGHGRTAKGPFGLALRVDGRHEPLIDQYGIALANARTAFGTLVDLAWVDAKRGAVVTADADGWITSIEDSDG